MIELLALPILFIMLTGFLLVPWLTPLSAVILLFHIIRNHKYPQALCSCLLCCYGLISSVGIWFVNPATADINKITDQPQFMLLPQLVVLLFACREQFLLGVAEHRKLPVYGTLVLSATALYWMAIAAVMSAAV